MLTRRDVLKQAGAAAALATTAPWWLVRRAHAARSEKLIVWSPVALAPQVDKLLKEQTLCLCQASGDQGERAPIRRDRHRPIGRRSWWRRWRREFRRMSAGEARAQGALYRAQGHLLEVTDVVEKMQQVPGGLFDASLNAVMYKGKAYSVPQSISPSPLVTRMDILEAAKVDPPKTWDEFIEVCKKAAEAAQALGLWHVPGAPHRYRRQCDGCGLALWREAGGSRR